MSKKLLRDNSYSVNHCCERFLERYGKELQREIYDKWNNKINKWMNEQNKNNDFKIISTDKINITNTSYIIKYEKSDFGLIYFVYESERSCITTFLPIKSVENRIKVNKKSK